MKFCNFYTRLGNVLLLIEDMNNHNLRIRILRILKISENTRNLRIKKKLRYFIFAIFTQHHAQSHALNDYYVKISICKAIYYSSSYSSALSLSITMQKKGGY